MEFVHAKSATEALKRTLTMRAHQLTISVYIEADEDQYDHLKPKHGVDLIRQPHSFIEEGYRKSVLTSRLNE